MKSEYEFECESDFVVFDRLTQNHRSYQLLDDRINRICKGRMEEEVIPHNLIEQFPSKISLNPPHNEYYSPFRWGTTDNQRRSDNIHSITQSMARWNDSKHHDVSFALRACLCNYPPILTVEDIDDSFIGLIDGELNVNEPVANALFTMAQDQEFRDSESHSHLLKHTETPSELYLNAKDHSAAHLRKDQDTMYPMRYIKVMPLQLELTMKHQKPTQIFNGSLEGHSFAKLSFTTRSTLYTRDETRYSNVHHYRPRHFHSDSDTLRQVRSVLSSSGIVIGSTRYRLMWYGHTDCKRATVTMVAPQLLPTGFTLSGLRIKYRIDRMLSQKSRMHHVSALETTATKIEHQISLQCISRFDDEHNRFDGVGIVRKEWIRRILLHDFKSPEDEYRDFAHKNGKELEKYSVKILRGYLRYLEHPNPDSKEWKTKTDFIYQILPWRTEQEKILSGSDGVRAQEVKPRHYAKQRKLKMQPFYEVMIGDVSCILAVYPQSDIQGMCIRNGWTGDHQNEANILLPHRKYEELIRTEYEKHSDGMVMWLDNDSDDEIKNAEEFPVNDSESKPKAFVHPELESLRMKGIPQFLLDTVQNALQHIERKSGFNASEISKDKRSEFRNLDIGAIPYEKMLHIKERVNVPLYIHDGSRVCAPLTMSKSMMNILEYHRQRDDAESKCDENGDGNEHKKILEKMVKMMVEDNKVLMDDSNLMKSLRALRFLDVHNEMELHWRISKQIQSHPESAAIDLQSAECGEMLQIRRRILRQCAIGLEVPFITEPFPSRRMMAIPDHTGRLPEGKIFVQLKLPESAPKKCHISDCLQPIKELQASCENVNNPHLVQYCRWLQQEVVVMESNALSPLSLRSFSAVYDQELARMFMNQEVLVFSSKGLKGTAITTLLSGTSDEDDTSYLRPDGRGKVFDVVVFPDIKLCSNYKYYHVDQPLKHSDFSPHNLPLEQWYLNEFKMAFLPSKYVEKNAPVDFRRDLGLTVPSHDEQKGGDYDDDDEDEENEMDRADISLDAPFWSRSTRWIMDREVSTMEQYADYFVEFNAVNYAPDLRELFEIEAQKNSLGMGLEKCRLMLKLYQHFVHCIQLQYVPGIDLSKTLHLEFPHHMAWKPMAQRKHALTLCGMAFDAVMESFPRDMAQNESYLRSCNLNSELISDPKRDYREHVMEQQEAQWSAHLLDKKEKELKCVHCKMQFHHWWQKREHMKSAQHNAIMQTLALSAADREARRYLDRVGDVKDHEPKEDDDGKEQMENGHLNEDQPINNGQSEVSEANSNGVANGNDKVMNDQKGGDMVMEMRNDENVVMNGNVDESEQKVSEYSRHYGENGHVASAENVAELDWLLQFQQGVDQITDKIRIKMKDGKTWKQQDRKQRYLQLKKWHQNMKELMDQISPHHERLRDQDWWPKNIEMLEYLEKHKSKMKHRSHRLKGR